MGIIVETSSVVLRIWVINHVKYLAKCLVYRKHSVIISVLWKKWILLAPCASVIPPRVPCTLRSLLHICWLFILLISFHMFVFICNFTSQAILVWLIRDQEGSAKKRAWITLEVEIKIDWASTRGVCGMPARQIPSNWKTQWEVHSFLWMDVQSLP